MISRKRMEILRRPTRGTAPILMNMGILATGSTLTTTPPERGTTIRGSHRRTVRSTTTPSGMAPTTRATIPDGGIRIPLRHTTTATMVMAVTAALHMSLATGQVTGQRGPSAACEAREVRAALASIVANLHRLPRHRLHDRRVQ
jgi:hypothetical protein